MKKIDLTFFLIIAGVAAFSPVFADTSIVSGIPEGATAAQVIVYFFNLGMALGSFFAVIMLIIAGAEYMMARGNPSKLEEAKGRIKNAFLGLIVLLSSLLILNTINPELSSIKINDLSKEEKQEIAEQEISNMAGVYLYKSNGDSLFVQSTKPTFGNDNFYQQTTSIKFVNAEDYKYGAILFTKEDLKGNCSYALGDINDMGTANGNENNPPIGNNTLASIQVFKSLNGTPTIRIYNTVDCIKRSDEYGKVEESTSVCTITGKDGFEDIKTACPNFKGSIVSIKSTTDTGVLLKSANKDAAGNCQFFIAGNSQCINTVKQGYVYTRNSNGSDIPFSFMLFPLYVK
jgi:hypothetical protein